MNSTAKAYPTSSAESTEIFRRPLKPEQVEFLLESANLPRGPRSTLLHYWRICKKPSGDTIHLFASRLGVIFEADISPRTAYYHFRYLEGWRKSKDGSKVKSGPPILENVHDPNKRIRPGYIRRPPTYRLNLAALSRENMFERKACRVRYEEHKANQPLSEPKGPQRVEAPQATKHAPAATLQEVRRQTVPEPSKFSHQNIVRSKPKLSKRNTAKFAGHLAVLMRGYTSRFAAACEGGWETKLDPSHPDYRAPMNFRAAMQAACKVWRRDPDSMADDLKHWGWKFDGENDS